MVHLNPIALSNVVRKIQRETNFLYQSVKLVRYAALENNSNVDIGVAPLRPERSATYRCSRHDKRKAPPDFPNRRLRISAFTSGGRPV